MAAGGENDKIRRWSDDGRSIGELKEDRKEVVDYSMRQSGKQAVDQSGYWSPQTGACPWQVGGGAAEDKKYEIDFLLVVLIWSSNGR